MPDRDRLVARFPYVAKDKLPTSLMPSLPMTISLGNRSVQVVGLLDSGAAVSVLPYSIGLAIGAEWEEQRSVLSLTGSLGQHEARALIVQAQHPQIISDKPVHLAFAWTRLDSAPVIFGQMNFFLEFDVCFYRSQGLFEVQVKKNHR